MPSRTEAVTDGTEWSQEALRARDVDSIESVKVDKKGGLYLTALDAVVPDAAKQLQRRLERRIPLVSLPDLLHEVDWDEVLRLAASIRHGTVSAALIMRKLAAYPRQKQIARALNEIGQLE